MRNVLAVAVSLLMVAGLASADIWSGAMVLYQMDEAPDAALVTDATGNTSGVIPARNDTALPTLITSGAPFGNAWDFSATDRSIHVANNAVIQAFGDDAASNGHTWAAWVKLAPTDVNANGNTRLFGLNGVSDNQMWHNNLQGTDPNGVWLAGGTPTVPAATGEWVHVALVSDFTSSVDNIQWYVDGAAFGDPNSANLTGITGSTNNLIIGARLNAGNYWNGAIDDFVVFDGALTADQVTQLYTQGGASFIPEPATMAMLGIGGIGVLIRRRRRA